MPTPLPPKSLEEKLESVNQLLKSRWPNRIEEQGTALGVKLALIMAMEIRDKKQLGSESGQIIAEWVNDYGEAQADSAVKMARKLLLEPGLLEKELENRLIK